MWKRKDMIEGGKDMIEGEKEQMWKKSRCGKRADVEKKRYD